MKKWFFRIIIICTLLLISSIYFFIPDKITFSGSILVQANYNGAYRCLTDKNQWSNLFGMVVKENFFNYNNVQYVISKKTIDGLIVHINDTDSSTKGVIRILPLSNDSSAIVWESSIYTGLNPAKKISLFLSEKKLRKNMDNILGNIKQYLNREENVYGLHISKETIKDSLLIYLKQAYNQYPNDKDIFETESKLRSYAISKGAHITNYTMTNTTKSDSAGFETIVAVPIDRYIEGSGNIELKLLVQGNILVAEIKGGTATILNAQSSMENYISDHQYECPAVPYQSLITNRMTEKDTTKWVTKICYPVY